MSSESHPDTGYKNGFDETGEKLPPDYQAFLDKQDKLLDKNAELDEKLNNLITDINKKVAF